jgi:hypothetical protein
VPAHDRARTGAGRLHAHGVKPLPRTVRNRADGRSLTLAEALDLRKALNTRIGDLHTQVTSSAWQRVIYKEGRDIVQETHLDYARCVDELGRARLEFRHLNRALRAASHRLEVDFRDE